MPASPARELYEFFEAEGMEYVVCMGQNSVLLRFAEPLMAPLREALEAGEELIPPLWRMFLRRTQLEEARTARDHQSRYRPASRSQTQGQPALYCHQFEDHAEVHLQESLLRARRHRKPHQGTQARSGDRSHQLHELQSQPVSGPDDRCRFTC